MNQRKLWHKIGWLLCLVMLCVCTAACAQSGTTLTVDLKGVTPSGVDAWHSISLSGRFDVLADGETIGRVTANPSAAAIEAGETDTIVVPDGQAITLQPIAEDIDAGFVCEGPIPVRLSEGAENPVTVFAYAKRGLLKVNNVSTDGTALSAAEFMVLDGNGAMVLSFVTDDKGGYVAEQALENGTYQLVQMRSPDGTLPLEAALSFDVVTYFGSEQSMTVVQVQNAPVPTQNATCAALSVTAAGFERGAAAQTGRVTAALEASNDLPLYDVTVTLDKASLLDRGGNVLSGDNAVFVEGVTVNGSRGFAVQALDAKGTAIGDKTTHADGETVKLTDAASAAVTLLDERGESVVAEQMSEVELTFDVRYEAVAFLPTEPSAASAQLPVRVGYTYHYTDTDGVGVVNAPSDIPAQTATLTIPDGKLTLTAQTSVDMLEDGTYAVRLSTNEVPQLDTALTMIAQLPEGVRVAQKALDERITLLRTASGDRVLFDAQLWADDGIVIPIASGDADELTLWALDPQTLPMTIDEPYGDLIACDTHESDALLDAVCGAVNGRYAKLAVLSVEPPISAAVDATAMTELFSGAVEEENAEATISTEGLAVLVRGERAIYGALTDASGAFSVLGDETETIGAWTVALPQNTMSAATREMNQASEANVSLPAHGVTVGFSRMSKISGAIMTTDGKPVGGVALTLAHNGGETAAETNANGAYAFDALEAGEYTLQATLPEDRNAELLAFDGAAVDGKTRLTTSAIGLTYGSEQTLDLTVQELAKISGTVLEQNQPVEGLTFTLTDAQNNTLTAQTDAEGRFAFAALPQGAYRLATTIPERKAISSVDGAAANAVESWNADYEVKFGETRDVRLSMESTATITGQIATLPEGSRIAAASVNEQLSAQTDAQGRFSFDGVIAGDYTVYAPLMAGETLAEGSEWSVTQQGDMIWTSVTVLADNTYELPNVTYVAMTAIEGVAYMDDNASFTRDDGEQLMSGVPVALQRLEGDAWTDVQTVKTDAYGRYAFENLEAATYRVVSQATNGVYVAAVGNSPLSVGDGSQGIMSSADLALSQGEMITCDVALSQPASLHVAAFNDSNENGVRGEYERAVTGVTVEVMSGETAVASAVTDASGEALLTDVAPGTYTVRFTLPDGYRFTTVGEGMGIGVSAAAQSDSNVASTVPLTFAAGQTIETATAAIPVGSFSGRVWSDLNNNGVMDADEPGVSGVVLTLSGVKTGGSYQITTDETGEYRFAMLRNDTYNFSAQAPEGMLFARYTQSGGDSRSVFTVDGTKASRQFVVSGAENVTDKNVGLIQTAALRGVAFLDMNYNGVYDDGEPTYAGVTLELIKNSNSNSMGKTVTGEDGLYEFGGLRGGDYRLRAILPDDGSIFTTNPANATGLYNQFVAREGRRENSIASIAIDNGATVETCVGVALGAKISGNVFLDAAYDGSKSNSDKNLAGVKIQLTDADGNVVQTAASNNKGNYTLEGIMPGAYTLRFLRKDGYAFTRYRPNEAGGNHVSVLAKDGYGETEAITVAMGQVVTDVNAGMLQSSTLAGVFFDDLNDNGLQDEGEAGYTDGKVRLLSEDGEIDLTESVAEDGSYFFDGVMPGAYTVTYLLPEHATMARVVEGGNTVEPQGRENVVSGFKVEAGKAYAAPLAGAVTLGSFEGSVYHDANGNGQRDDGEEMLNGAVVTLEADTAEAQSVTTGADGTFRLEGLRPESYRLSIMLPEGYIFSSNIEQSGLTLDTLNAQTIAIDWAALISRAENKVGAVKPATIAGSVWLDENKDGVQGDDERLMNGLAYQLYDENRGAVVKTVRADEAGRFTFENVRPSTYTVRFELPAQSEPADDALSTFALNGTMMVDRGIVINESDVYTDVHGGLVSRTSIGGTISLDENGSRSALAGVEVQLFEGDGTTAVQTTTTDEGGAYRFDGLWPDTYRIVVREPADMLFVRPDDPNYAEGDCIVASTEDGWGRSDMLALEMAQHRMSENVICIKTAKIGDQAWLDSNKNGLIDGEEPSLNGVTVNLLQNGEVKYTAQTDAFGYYELSGVYPGTYTLQAVAYSELDITTTVPSLRIISSCLTSGDGLSAQSEPFDVLSGETNFDFNLGYVLKDGASMPAAISPAPVQNWTSAVPTTQP